jgi:hypothetical protein
MRLVRSHVGQRLSNVEYTGLQVYVFPAKSQQFATPEPGAEHQKDRRKKPIIANRWEKPLCYLFPGEGLRLFALFSRGFNQVSDIADDELVLLSLGQGTMQERVQASVVLCGLTSMH